MSISEVTWYAPKVLRPYAAAADAHGLLILLMDFRQTWEAWETKELSKKGRFQNKLGLPMASKSLPKNNDRVTRGLADDNTYRLNGGQEIRKNTKWS